MLYIVATPIGNLGDITFRAVETLKNVDLIACEDTRTSKILLKHYNIEKPLISFHSYSGVVKTEEIIKKLKSGLDVALISDAGTPGISDPGYVLIKEAIINDVEVVPIPGVTAFTTALMASGLQINHFLYLGFLPVKKGRQTILIKLSEQKKDKVLSSTIVIYESVHRILKTLNDLKNYFGEDHNIVVARELTKMHEEFIRDSVKNVILYFENNKNKVRGEYVIMF